MELSKGKYTYGSSYEGSYYFRLNNETKKGEVIGLFRNGILLPNNVTVELEYNIIGNTIGESTATKITKKEFINGLNQIKKLINKIK